MTTVKEIEFSLIPEDFVALAEYHDAQLPKWKIPLYVGLLVLGMALFILQIRRMFNEFGEVLGLVGLIFALSGGLIWYVNRHRIAARAVRREIRKGKNSRVLEPRRVSISPDGISESSADSAGVTAWSAIEKIVVRKNHAFIYFSTVAAMILPKRAFASEVDFMDFVETARGYFEAANQEASSK